MTSTRRGRLRLAARVAVAPGLAGLDRFRIEQIEQSDEYVARPQKTIQSLQRESGLAARLERRAELRPGKVRAPLELAVARPGLATAKLVRPAAEPVPGALREPALLKQRLNNA